MQFLLLLCLCRELKNTKKWLNWGHASWWYLLQSRYIYLDYYSRGQQHWLMNRAGQLPGTRQLSDKPTAFLELGLNHNHDLGILPDCFQRRRRVPRVIIYVTLHICDLMSVKRIPQQAFIFIYGRPFKKVEIKKERFISAN